MKVGLRLHGSYFSSRCTFLSSWESRTRAHQRIVDVQSQSFILKTSYSCFENKILDQSNISNSASYFHFQRIPISIALQSNLNNHASNDTMNTSNIDIDDVQATTMECNEPALKAEGMDKKPPIGSFILTSSPLLLGVSLDTGTKPCIESIDPFKCKKQEEKDIRSSKTDAGTVLKLKTTGPPKLKKATILPQTLLDQVTETVKMQYSVQTEEKTHENKYVEISDLSEEHIVMTVNSEQDVNNSNETLCSTEVANVVKTTEILQLFSEDGKVSDSPTMLETGTGTVKPTSFKHSLPDDDNTGCCSLDISHPNSSSIEANHSVKGQITETVSLELTALQCDKDRLKRKDKRKSKISATKNDVVYDISSLFDGRFDQLYRKSKKKSKQAVKKKSYKSEDKGKDQQDKASKEKPKRKRPTHFIAIQVDNPEVHEVAKKVQDTILSQQKELAAVMISPVKFHFTLMVMHLGDKEDIERAKTVLEAYKTKYSETFAGKPFILDINGVDNFRDSVVFSSVWETTQRDHLKSVAAEVQDCFNDHGIVSMDKKGEFQPHLTLAKMSKDSGKLKKKGIRKINSEFYREHREVYFGRQFVTHIQLCDMFPPKKRDGYYNIEHTVQIVEHDCYKGIAKSAEGLSNTKDTEVEENTVEPVIKQVVVGQSEKVKSGKSETDIVKLSKEIVEFSIQSAISELKRLSQENLKEASHVISPEEMQKKVSDMVEQGQGQSKSEAESHETISAMEERKGDLDDSAFVEGEVGNAEDDKVRKKLTEGDAMIKETKSPGSDGTSDDEEKIQRNDAEKENN